MEQKKKMLLERLEVAYASRKGQQPELSEEADCGPNGRAIIGPILAQLKRELKLLQDEVNSEFRCPTRWKNGDCKACREEEKRKMLSKSGTKVAGKRHTNRNDPKAEKLRQLLYQALQDNKEMILKQVNNVRKSKEGQKRSKAEEVLLKEIKSCGQELEDALSMMDRLISQRRRDVSSKSQPAPKQATVKLNESHVNQKPLHEVLRQTVHQLQAYRTWMDKTPPAKKDQAEGNQKEAPWTRCPFKGELHVHALLKGVSVILKLKMHHGGRTKSLKEAKKRVVVHRMYSSAFNPDNSSRKPKKIRSRYRSTLALKRSPANDCLQDIAGPHQPDAHAQLTVVEKTSVHNEIGKYDSFEDASVLASLIKSNDKSDEETSNACGCFCGDNLRVYTASVVSLPSNDPPHEPHIRNPNAKQPIYRTMAVKPSRSVVFCFPNFPSDYNIALCKKRREGHEKDSNTSPKIAPSLGREETDEELKTPLLRNVKRQNIVPVLESDECVVKIKNPLRKIPRAYKNVPKTPKGGGNRETVTSLQLEGLERDRGQPTAKVVPIALKDGAYRKVARLQKDDIVPIDMYEKVGRLEKDYAFSNIPVEGNYRKIARLKEDEELSSKRGGGYRSALKDNAVFFLDMGRTPDFEWNSDRGLLTRGKVEGLKTLGLLEGIESGKNEPADVSSQLKTSGKNVLKPADPVRTRKREKRTGSHEDEVDRNKGRDAAVSGCLRPNVNVRKTSERENVPGTQKKCSPLKRIKNRSQVNRSTAGKPGTLNLKSIVKTSDQMKYQNSVFMLKKEFTSVNFTENWYVPKRDQGTTLPVSSFFSALFKSARPSQSGLWRYLKKNV